MSYFTHGMYGVWQFLMCDNHGPIIRLSKKFTLTHTPFFLEIRLWIIMLGLQLKPQLCHKLCQKNCVFCCGSSILLFKKLMFSRYSFSQIYTITHYMDLLFCLIYYLQYFPTWVGPHKCVLSMWGDVACNMFHIISILLYEYS